MHSITYLDAAAVSGLGWDAVLAALDTAARTRPGGADRIAVPVTHGQLLLMPGETATGVGVKVLGLAPDNPARGLARVQGLYVLLDAGTLTPAALLDGTALTNVRTPGVSALAVRALAPPDARRLLVFGTGPQALGHIAAIRHVRPIEDVVVVARDRDRAAAVVNGLGGLDARVGEPVDVAGADVVVCATTARRPLFDGALLPPSCCVVAVGSHEPDARELDDAVFARAATVVVEDRRTALREAGDVIAAVGAGAVTADDLVELADVLTATAPDTGISVFKSVGVGWQDLAVAEAVLAAHRRVTVD